MAYNGGCFIGVPIKQTYPIIIKNSQQTQLPGSATDDYTVQEWPLVDGGWSPYLVQKYSEWLSYQVTAYYHRMETTGLPAGYKGVIYGAKWVVNKPALAIQTTASNTYGGVTPKEQTMLEDYVNNINSGHFLFITSANFYSFRIVETGQVSATNTVYGLSECAPVAGYELPNQEELVSFRRETTAPAAIEIKTLDGTIRKVSTGQPATTISARWQWSDDGTIKSFLAGILRYAAMQNYPLIIYLPGANWQQSGASIDLVWPSSGDYPVITSPAPGVYELTIEGDCQP